MNIYHKIINDINLYLKQKEDVDIKSVIISIIKKYLINSNIDKNKLKYIKPKWLIYKIEEKEIKVLKFCSIAEEFSIFVKYLNIEFENILNISLQEKIKKLDNFKF